MRKKHCTVISCHRPMTAQTTGLAAKVKFIQDLMTSMTGNYEEIINNIKFKSWMF